MKVNRYNFIFNLTFILGIVFTFLTYVNIQIDFNLNFIVFAFLIPSLFLMNIYEYGLSLQKLFQILLLIFVFFLSIFLTRQFTVQLFQVLCLISLSILSSEKNESLVKISLIVKVLFLLSILFLNYIGVLQDVVLLRDSSIRHSFGFAHPNSLGAVFLSIIFDFSLIYSNKQWNVISRTLTVAFLGALIYAVDTTVNSRTTTLMAILILVLIVFKEKFRRLQVSRNILTILILGITFLGVYLPINYNNGNSFFVYLDTLFTNRLNYANIYYQNFGIGWLPRSSYKLTLYQSLVINMENFYINLLIFQGIIIFFIFLIFVLIEARKFRFSFYNAGLIVLAMLTGLFEVHGLSVFFCSVLMFKNTYLNYEYEGEIDDIRRNFSRR
ncbi:hypothetical protein JEQ21_06380 [Streptococcus sp. 121]|uniref:hypothetical protein n=1 Tax=Streptococcus sp. 121 TaxID=2797637 RepID=UPI0018F081B8|nr:hypothetical protein [Streptococcus sp. 121]MBJ6746082.1 hypothetical protein [Streptococcus sp. 121]